jgi:hypothetical protein
MNMTYACAATAVIVAVLSIPAAHLLVGRPAEAKGCLNGTVVGGIIGHLAGRHGVIGAAADCVVGSHEANKKQPVRR